MRVAEPCISLHLLLRLTDLRHNHDIFYHVSTQLIAIEHGGAQLLSRLLCVDPTCHLMAIIIVNLSFADSELRRELVVQSSSIQLVDALSYALLLSTLHPDEHESRPSLIELERKEIKEVNLSPRKLLAAAMTEDQRRTASGICKPFDPRNLAFPETARWSLCALKNLTRSSKDPLAAHALISSGVLPLILNFVAKGAKYDPSKWEANSLEDAALATLLNLSSISAARPYLRELDAVQAFLRVSESAPTVEGISDEQKRLVFQCTKARMCIAFLLGSEGHFGQARASSEILDYLSRTGKSITFQSASEAKLLTEILGNTLQERPPKGPGGYSASTFSVKATLSAIRFLLTDPSNQSTFANYAGKKLNSLFLLALARHAIQVSPLIDAEAAEHACFSLYLLSGLGFEQPFLPASVGDSDWAEKVFDSYLNTESITSAGRHAASQLKLRWQYLSFQGAISLDGIGCLTDYELDDEIQGRLDLITTIDKKAGARPSKDIFDRPILCGRSHRGESDGTPWNDSSSIVTYGNVLLAAQELSYGSTKVRHLGAIDDISIANNIANSANGKKTESYSYCWSWQDEVEKKFEKVYFASDLNGGGFVASLIAKAKCVGSGDEPVSIFGMSCCSAGTR